MQKLVVHTDGGCRDNPGPGAWAFVVRNTENVENFAGFLSHCTNNQAEYRALEAACTVLARRNGPDRPQSVDIFSDSQLMVEQIHGRYRVNEPIRPFYESAAAAFRSLQLVCPVTLTHVKRDLNKEADLLCNKIMDKHGIKCSRVSTKKKKSADAA